MLTVKHQEDNGYEGVYSAESIAFSPATKAEFAILFVCVTKTPNTNYDGIARISSGIVYVMNEQGKTVAVYGQGGRANNWAPLNGKTA